MTKDSETEAARRQLYLAPDLPKYRYTDAEGRSWTVRITRKTKVTIKRAAADDDLDDEGTS
jgi:hypothetical protein